MNHNKNSKFFNNLSKDFFKNKPKGDTPAKCLKMLNEQMYKYMPKIQNFAACFVMKDGTNYWINSDCSYATLLGLLGIMINRIQNYHSGNKDTED